MRGSPSRARRRWLRAGATVAAASLAAPWAFAAPAAVLRIGHLNGMLRLLQAHGTLDRRLRAAGIAVRWLEMESPADQIAAFEEDRIDFGDLGEAAFLQARAMGVPLVLAGASTPRPRNVGLLVRGDSACRTPADLRGRTIAVAPATPAHALVLRLLERERIAATEVTLLPVPLEQGHEAFRGGEADAWAVADPFLAAAEITQQARVLVDGRGLVANRILYCTGPRPPREASLLLEALRGLDAWAGKHRGTLSVQLARQWGVPLAVAQAVVARTDHGTVAADAALLRELQDDTDLFTAGGALPPCQPGCAAPGR